MRKTNFKSDEEFLDWENSVIALECLCLLRGWTAITYSPTRCCRFVGNAFQEVAARHSKLFGIRLDVSTSDLSCYTFIRELHPAVIKTLLNELSAPDRSALFVEAVGKALGCGLQPAGELPEPAPALQESSQHQLVRRGPRRS